MDAHRALGLLRSRAKEWNLDPARIGIIGFSAGGHLAAMAANHHEQRTYEPFDEHDRASCRPDFCLLMYPDYLTNPILEPKADPALEQEKMSPARTPPTLITVVRPDQRAGRCSVRSLPARCLNQIILSFFGIHESADQTTEIEADACQNLTVLLALAC